MTTIEAQQIGIGRPEDIPHIAGSRCRSFLADDVAKQLNREYARTGTALPCELGTCRMCGERLPMRQVRVGPHVMPVLQCDRIAQMWDAADRIRTQWRQERAKAEHAAAELGKREGTRKEYF